MKSKILLMIALLLVIAGSAAANQTEKEWTKFTSPEGLFSVSVPAKATIEAVPDADDAKKTHNRVQSFGEGYGVIVEYFDDIKWSDSEVYFDNFRKGVVEAVNGSLISESKIALAGHPGRQIEVELANSNGTKFFCTLKVYLVGRHLYSLALVRPQSMDRTVVANIGEKYFPSFKLLKED